MLWGTSLFLPRRQRDLIKKPYLVAQGSERPAHVPTGEMAKRSHSVIILPGAKSLPLSSIGGGFQFRHSIVEEGRALGVPDPGLHSRCYIRKIPVS